MSPELIGIAAGIIGAIILGIVIAFLAPRLFAK